MRPGAFQCEGRSRHWQALCGPSANGPDIHLPGGCIADVGLNLKGFLWYIGDRVDAFLQCDSLAGMWAIFRNIGGVGSRRPYLLVGRRRNLGVLGVRVLEHGPHRIVRPEALMQTIFLAIGTRGC